VGGRLAGLLGLPPLERAAAVRADHQLTSCGHCVIYSPSYLSSLSAVRHTHTCIHIGARRLFAVGGETCGQGGGSAAWYKTVGPVTLLCRHARFIYMPAARVIADTKG
jgi:hypothetical protein